VGGLMPTTLGSVPFSSSSSSSSPPGCGSSEEKQKLALLRSRLKRTHNVIENMIEKEQMKRCREVVLEDKARAAKLSRGEKEEEGDDDYYVDDDHNGAGVSSVTVQGDYEGWMAKQRALMIEQNQKVNSKQCTIIKSVATTDDEKKFAALMNKKWSLSRAILLHGTLEHVQQWVKRDVYNDDINGEEWTHSSLENERRHLHKRLDDTNTTLRSSSHKLYVAFALLEKAAQALNFHGIANRTFREAVSCLVKFATARDDLKIKGISSGIKKGLAHVERLSLSLLSRSNDSDVIENLLSTSALTSKTASKKSSLWNELHRMKQYASLCAAILHISAKRTGVGRTLAEVCSAFGAYTLVADGRCSEKKELVHPNRLSRAMEELKQTLPDAFVPVENAIALSVPSNSNARVTPDYFPSDASSPFFKNAEESALADLTSRMASSLNLPPSAAVAAIAVATQWRRGDSASQEATTPGTLSKHIRPRQRKSKGALKSDPDEIVAAASLLLVSIAGGIMQRLAEQALKNSETSSKSFSRVETFAHWNEWNSQAPWHREVTHLEHCTGLPRKSILTCYSNTLYPLRAHLLEAVRLKFELGDQEGDKLLQNIVVAVPLMSLRHIS
jgi:hypothetical protein